MSNRPTPTDLKARLSLADVIPALSGYAPELGGMIHCPFPWHDDRTPSFHVNNEGTSWKCFGACQLGGDIFTFTGVYQNGVNYNNKSQFYPVMQELIRIDGGFDPATPRKVLKQAVQNKEFVSPTRKNQGVWKLALSYYSRLLVEGDASLLSYLRDTRGFTIDAVTSFRMGYVPYKGSGIEKFAKAIKGFTRQDLLDARILNTSKKSGDIYETYRGYYTFADVDRSGNVWHITGRKGPERDGDKSPKLLSLPHFNKTVYGYRIQKRNAKYAFLMEAPWDAISFLIAGVPALAINGLEMSTWQLSMLTQITVPIFPVYDNDDAGREARQKWPKLLTLGKALNLPISHKTIPIKDPNDLLVAAGPEHIKATVQHFIEKEMAWPRKRSR